MRWTERPARLPLLPLAALEARAPGLAVWLAGLASEAGLLVAVEAAARETALAHLGRHEDERGGLLLGEVYAAEQDPATSRVLRITQAVPAEDYAATGVSLRMASGVWEAARARLGQDELVVGWFHSHPGLGAFFSAADRRTQRAFFAHPYSAGWVVDPLRGESAWFIGADAAPPAGVAHRTAGDGGIHPPPDIEVPDTESFPGCT